MVAMKKSAFALAMAAAVSAQTSSVVNVFIPDADEQVLLGSVIASDASKTTMAISCPSNADMSECGFGPDAVTITFGASTFRAEETLDPLSLVLDCNIAGTTAATCTETYIGPADILDLATNTVTDTTATDTNTNMLTTTTTTVLSQSQVVFIPVTITAAADSSNDSSASTTGASGNASTATSTGSADSSAASTSAGTSGITPDQGSGAGSMVATRWEMVSAAGAGLIGLALILL